MSNPTIGTKLTALFKGIFGRKDPKDQVPTTVPDKKDETPATESAAPEPGEAVEETPAEKAPVEDKTEEKVEEPAAEEAEEKAEVEPVAEAPATEAAKAAEPAEEPRDESTTPATEDVPEDGSALAEEITAAEAHTTVASDEVLEKVRKDAAPAAEDLAVPTYDELTLPSIRARLRKLTIAQVRDLRAYEVAHQGRPEFIKMYDNRITKLEAEA